MSDVPLAPTLLDAIETLTIEHETLCDPAPFTSERALIERLRAALDTAKADLITLKAEAWETAAEAWRESAEAHTEWMNGNPGPSGTWSDPPRNPYDRGDT